jgi:hypothetical protein
VLLETPQVREFRRKLHDFPREKLLEIIEEQNPSYIFDINRIEWVFKNKLSHLNDDKGNPIVGRDLTHEELVRLVDPPFMFSKDMMRSGFGEDMQHQIHIASDPIIWSKNILGATPRVYQALVLREPNDNIVLRWGRRLGKALDINTDIPTPSGWKKMIDLQDGDKVFDENGHVCNVTAVTDIQHDHDCYKVTFSDGSFIYADAEHEWGVHDQADRVAITNGQPRPLQHITTEEMSKNVLGPYSSTRTEYNYSVPLTKPVEYPEKPLKLHPWIYGYMVANGYPYSNHVRILAKDVEEVTKCFAEYGYELQSVKGNKYQVVGLDGQLFEPNVIRDEYMFASVEQRTRLLTGLCDARATTTTDYVEFQTGDKIFVDQVDELVCSLGAEVRRREKVNRVKGIDYGISYKAFWLANFNCFSLERKRPNRPSKGTKQPIRMVVSIEKIESRPVKCITVDSRSRLYLAGKQFIPTHNSYVLSMYILWYSFVHEKARTLVLAPAKTQVGLIYDQILELAELSPIVSDAITKSPRSPQYEIYLSNGSIIRLFTTGFRSGQKADNARGQEADMIVLDEMDYMGADDLVALMAMLQKTNPDKAFNKKLIGASTPTGQRGTYWRWCFPAGTAIDVPTGYKYIEDIKIGDQVFDAWGKPDIVSNVFKHEYEGDFIELRSNGSRSLKTTADHPHLVRRNGTEEFIAASDIIVGDELIVPAYFYPDHLDNNFEWYLPYDDIWDSVLKLRKDNLSYENIAKLKGLTKTTVNYRLNRFSENGSFADTRRCKTVKQAKDLQEKIIKLEDLTALGLYAVEGHLLREYYPDGSDYIKGVAWTFHTKEVLHRKICTDFLKNLNLKSRLVDKEKVDNTIQVYCYDSGLGILFKNLFDEKEKKRVPKFIFSKNKESALSFFNGVMLGDASMKFEGWDKGWALGFVSYRLIHDIWLLLKLHGYKTKISERLPYNNNLAVWVLNYAPSYDFETSDHADYIPVEKINRSSGKEYVYNFETKLTHTYLAKGFSTHNCTDPEEGYTSFWYPSYVNPLWDKGEEAKARRRYRNEQHYRHEIEADWGEDAEGVYPRKYVDLAFGARKLSEYDVFKPDHDKCIYSLGVDWDKHGAGVNIVIAEADKNNPGTSMIRVIYRSEIIKGDFTYIESIDEIIRLDAKFQFKHIYIDQGAGEVQAEMLHKYGLENPHTKMHTKTKPCHFSNTIELRDPYTRQIEKKRLKPFMIENLVFHLEQKRIAFHEDDDELYLQLISYVKIRETESGNSIFAAGGDAVDHAHDALLLALFAFTENYDSLFQGIYKDGPKAISNEFFLTAGSPAETEVEEEKTESEKGYRLISSSRPASFKRSSTRRTGGSIKRPMF